MTQDSRIRLLFVDDESLLLRTIVRSLARAQIDIQTALNGVEALAILRSYPIDVLVSDIDMPEMNGIELMKVARNEFPDVPRVLITGNATTERALMAINEGEIVRFLTKPFSMSVLQDIVLSLGERTQRVHREGAALARRARADGLRRAVEARFPDATDVATSGGEVTVDVAALRGRLTAAGWHAAARLLGTHRR